MTHPLLRLNDATLAFGHRTLWHDLNLAVEAGEFITILGANGSGKSSLLRVILGQLPLKVGSAQFQGEPVRRGDRRIGYIPQQRIFAPGVPMRGKDLVALGVSGHKFGFAWPQAQRRRQVEEALDAVGAGEYANQPVGQLSGGEQQRLRVAQALVGDPQLLLCDEPLLSLDLNHQRVLTDLINARRNQAQTAVLFVTHDVNPVLEMTDRVLYFAGGHFRIGTVDEVMRTEVLSQLYGTHIEVRRINGKIVAVGLPAADREHGDGVDAEPAAESNAGGQECNE